MKKSVVVKRFIPAPRDYVFDVFTNHETYSALPLVLSSQLLIPAVDNSSNGVGAVREIKALGVTLKERVTDLSRPSYWDYHFIEWPLPLPHIGGRMTFIEVPGGTEVQWQTSYDIPDRLSWRLASKGLSIGTIGLLKLLIRLIGNEAISRLKK